MNHRTLRFVLAAVGVLAVALTLWFTTGRQPAPASEFVLIDGSRQRMADLRGQVTLVNFWATSCAPCVAEMPDLANTYNRFKSQGFELMAVAMAYDPPAYVVNFAQSRQLPFKVAIDNTGEIAKAWGDVQLTPTTYVVDKQGTIVKTYVGAPDFDELHGLIERLLAQQTV
ncbi:TlpA family protein disulfide reductase [Lampropedia puyangensis]|uniref:TlpA family protein disulfide reductase n=1 Tax=Lampropedia puyangensis TaxID=1330072 RepID=A0A4S8FCS2_9BURK|nr:TlpA disulfide reductase family protein [Lampropedia puyangensis]THU03652.1 TlpA family protein disulfide reductase [Lampropedia puyangensis]